MADEIAGRLERRFERLRHRKIPSIFWDARIAHFDADFGLEKTRPENLYITGPNGSGKSYLAGALARGWDAEWVSTLKLSMRVRKTFGPLAEESELEIFHELLEPRCVVIDDLLAGKKSEFTLSLLLVLINERIEMSKISIVTCDRSLADIDEIDSSLASRLGSFREIRLAGRDRRLDGGGGPAC